MNLEIVLVVVAFLCFLATVVWSLYSLRTYPRVLWAGGVGTPLLQLIIWAILYLGFVHIGSIHWAHFATVVMLLALALDIVALYALKRTKDETLVAYQMKLLKTNMLQSKQESEEEYLSRLKEHTSVLHSNLLQTLEDARTSLLAGKPINCAEICEKPFLSKTSFKIKDPILSALLQNKNALCAEKHIDAHFTIDEKGLSALTSLDACSVFANLIDNAINGCSMLDEKARFIKLTAGIRGGYYVIKVVNSALPARVITEGNKSAIAEGVKQSDNILPEHGWGCSILESLVQRYGGFFSTKQLPDTFEASFIIQLSAEKAQA
jgi:hypothetical protein